MSLPPEEPSVLKELPYLRSPDKKVELLLQACRELQYVRPGEAFTYSERARRIARTAKLAEREVHCMRMSGICLFAQHEYEPAKELFEAALKKYRKIRDKSGEARAHQNIGMTQRAMGRTDDAIASYRQAEQLSRDLTDTSLLMVVLNNIGSLYSTQVRPREALEAYSECLTIAERTDDANLRARLMGNIADVYQVLGDIDTGLEWSKRSLELHRANKDAMGVGLTLSNLGRIYKSVGNLDAARAVLSEALTVMSELPDHHARARILIVLAGVLLEKRFIAQAESMAEEAAQIFRDAHDVERELGCLLTLADIARMNNKHDASLALLKKAKKLSVGIESPASLIDIEQKWAALSEATKNVGDAEKHLLAGIKIADSNNMFSASVTLHRMLSQSLAKRSEFKGALKHEVLAGEAQQAADIEVRSRHSNALQLRLDVERMARERERIEVRAERMAFELESKERELNANALSIAQKNELLSGLVKDLTTAAAAKIDQRAGLIRDVIRRIENHRRSGEDWKNFAEQLKDVHDGFLQKVTQLYPSLTATEIKMVSLLKLNLNSKEIAELLSLELTSIEMYRHRLRKKLNIPSHITISAFLQSIAT